jgi:hypothetical protein
MTVEFPPPDARLADKVKIVRLNPKARACNGNDGRDGNFACDAVTEGHPAIDDDTEISRLVKLSTLEYERERKEAAKRLSVRPSILDRLVAAGRHEFDDDKQGRTLSLHEPEPWPERVNGADVFDELSSAIRRLGGGHSCALDGSHLFGRLLRDFAPACDHVAGKGLRQDNVAGCAVSHRASTAADCERDRLRHLSCGGSPSAHALD